MIQYPIREHSTLKYGSVTNHSVEGGVCVNTGGKTNNATEVPVTLSPLSHGAVRSYGAEFRTDCNIYSRYCKR